MTDLSAELLTLRAPRLLLRAWRDSDLAACAAMNADSEVMQHFPATLSPHANAQLVERNQEHIRQHGFGLWALEIPGELAFAGFVGLLRVGFTAHFTPAVEIGWRLVRPAWGHGFATEAAQSVLRHAFAGLQLKQVVSFTAPGNHRSQAVMRRLGMHTQARDNFEHPRLPVGHPLSVHVLYQLHRNEWLARQELLPAALPAIKVIAS
jgi:RimJ/RimL family protein N-acetyltransferase